MADSRSPEHERLLTLEEVARLCSLSQKAVRGAIQRGELRALKVCGRWRIPPAALRDWIDASVFTPVPLAAAQPPALRPGASLYGSIDRLHAIERELAQ